MGLGKQLLEIALAFARQLGLGIAQRPFAACQRPLGRQAWNAGHGVNAMRQKADAGQIEGRQHRADQDAQDERSQQQGQNQCDERHSEPQARPTLVGRVKENGPHRSCVSRLV